MLWSCQTALDSPNDSYGLDQTGMKRNFEFSTFPENVLQPTRVYTHVVLRSTHVHTALMEFKM